MALSPLCIQLNNNIVPRIKQTQILFVSVFCAQQNTVQICSIFFLSSFFSIYKNIVIFLKTTHQKNIVVFSVNMGEVVAKSGNSNHIQQSQDNVVSC